MKPFNTNNLSSAVILGTLVSFLFQQCIDCNNFAEPSIEGHCWMTPTTSPSYRLCFDGGGILQQTEIRHSADLNTTVHRYILRGDTLHIEGDSNNAPRRWQIQFLCDSLIRATNINGPIRTQFDMYRIE
jgi:hypothetical protein